MPTNLNNKNMAVLAFALLLATTIASAGERNWMAFGQEALKNAPAKIKNGSPLDQAKYVAAKVSSQMEADGIRPNSDLLGRVSSASTSWGDPARGTCGDCSNIMSEALQGAGLAKGTNYFSVATAGRGLFANLTDPVNSNHGTFAVTLKDDSGKDRTVVFDNWASLAIGDKVGLRTKWGYDAFTEKDAFNGMSLDEWVKRMRAEGYSQFGVGGDKDDPTFHSTMDLALKERELFLRRYRNTIDAAVQEKLAQLKKVWRTNPSRFAALLAKLQDRGKWGTDLVSQKLLKKVEAFLNAQTGLTPSQKMLVAEYKKQIAFQNAKRRYPALNVELFEAFYDPKAEMFLPPDTFTSLAKASEEEIRQTIAADLKKLAISDRKRELAFMEKLLDDLVAAGVNTPQAKAVMEKHAKWLKTVYARRGQQPDLAVSAKPRDTGWAMDQTEGLTIWIKHNRPRGEIASTEGGYWLKDYGCVEKTWSPENVVTKIAYYDGEHHFHGPYREYFSSGKLKNAREYVHGKKHGPLRLYSETQKGQRYLCIETQYADDLQDGWSLYWNFNRLPVLGNEEYYRKGKLHGTAVTYDRNGVPRWTRRYADGVLDGPMWSYAESGLPVNFKQYAKGVVVQEIRYNAQGKRKTAVFNHSSGLPREEHIYDDGGKLTQKKIYDAKGKLTNIIDIKGK